MEIRIKNIGDRLQCINGDPTQLKLTPLSALEVINHLMELDALGGPRMTNAEITLCRKRLIVFASEQFKNREN
jgi:hypothetical protein